MKKILAVILCIFSIFSLGGCLGIKLPELSSCDLPPTDPNAGLITSGDFMYKIEGKGTEDESARIIKLSKEGLEKKELIFPENIDGRIVKYIGINKIDLYGTPIKDTFYGKWETICIPPTVEFISKYALSATVDKTVYINYNENIDMFYEYAFVNEGVGNKLNIKIFTSKINLKSYYKCSTLKATVEMQEREDYATILYAKWIVA